MRSNTKSSITLPPAELRLVEELRTLLGARTKVEVVRRGLQLLKQSSDRDALRRAYAVASRATRAVTFAEVAELDALTGEGLDE